MAGEGRLVALTGASWNQITVWLRQMDGLRRTGQVSVDAIRPSTS